MSQFINSQKPDEARSGQSLQPQSTLGRKIDFINQTNFGSTSFTLSASGGQFGIRFEYEIYPEDLSEENRNINTVLPSLKVVLWPVFNIYVDTENETHFFGAGTGLTAGQQNITMSHFQHISPYTGNSASTSLVFQNNDSSDHTIYLTGGGFYVILA